MALLDLKAAMIAAGSIVILGTGAAAYMVTHQSAPIQQAVDAKPSTPVLQAAPVTAIPSTIAPSAQAADTVSLVIPTRFTIRLERLYRKGAVIGVSDGTPATATVDTICDLTVEADHSCSFKVPFVDGGGLFGPVVLRPHAGRPDRFAVTFRNATTDNLTWDDLLKGVTAAPFLRIAAIDKSHS